MKNVTRRGWMQVTGLAGLLGFGKAARADAAKPFPDPLLLADPLPEIPSTAFSSDPTLTYDERLVERFIDAARDKWDRTGLLEGIEREQDRRTIAVVLENQRLFNEIMGKTGSTERTIRLQIPDLEGTPQECVFWNSGFNDATMKRVSIPFVRRVMDRILAEGWLPIYPLVTPNSLVFYWRRRSKTQPDPQRPGYKPEYIYVKESEEIACSYRIFGKDYEELPYKDGRYSGHHHTGLDHEAEQIYKLVDELAEDRLRDATTDLALNAKNVWTYDPMSGENALTLPLMMLKMKETINRDTYDGGRAGYFWALVPRGHRGEFGYFYDYIAETAKQYGYIAGLDSSHESDILRRMLPQIYCGTPLRSLFRCTPADNGTFGYPDFRFSCSWSWEAARDLRVVHGLDARDELASILAEETALEITRYGIHTALKAAKEQPSLRTRANKTAFPATIKIAAARINADYIIMSPDSFTLLAKDWKPAVMKELHHSLGVFYTGTFHGVPVYLDPLMPTRIEALVGRQRAVKFRCETPLSLTPKVLDLDSFYCQRTGLIAKADFQVTHPDELLLVSTS